MTNTTSFHTTEYILGVTTVCLLYSEESLDTQTNSFDAGVFARVNIVCHAVAVNSSIWALFAQIIVPLMIVSPFKIVVPSFTITESPSYTVVVPTFVS